MRRITIIIQKIVVLGLKYDKLFFLNPKLGKFLKWDIGTNSALLLSSVEIFHIFKLFGFLTLVHSLFSHECCFQPQQANALIKQLLKAFCTLQSSTGRQTKSAADISSSVDRDQKKRESIVLLKQCEMNANVAPMLRDF